MEDTFYLSLSFPGIYDFLQEYLVYHKIENKYCSLENINKIGHKVECGKRENFKTGRICKYTGLI